VTWLVHGEEHASRALAAGIESRFHCDVRIPSDHETVVL